MIRTRKITNALAAVAVLTGPAALGTAALAAPTASAVTASGSSSGFTLSFPAQPSFPTFPSFPTPPTFPSFPPAAPAPPPIDTSTNGTTSIVTELAPGGENNDGTFDINEFDYHITALLVQSVLAADPHGPVSILADGTRRATFFQPDDEAWVLLARKLSGQALPLPGAATEQATYGYFQGLGTARLEKILSRYLTRLSPLGDVHLEGGDNLCATDFALRRQVRDPASFRFEAAVGQTPVPVRLRDASVCLALPHVAADGGSPDGDPSRYIDVTVTDGVARGPLVAHLYDLGPARGFVLAGLDRPLP